MMKRVDWSRMPRRRVVTGAVVALALASWAVVGSAQSADTSSQPRRAQGAGAQAPDQTLTKQLEELRAQLARLQAEIERQQQSTSPAPATGALGAAMSGGQMGQMGMRMGEMGRRMGMGEMGSMPPGDQMGMMEMHKGEMGMPPEGMRMPQGMGMGEMGGMASPGAPAPATGGGMQMGGAAAGSGMQMPGGPSATSAGAPAARPGRSTSALPGVPGASHLYHIGSTGFFLDQAQIRLTSEQQATLNRIKERALLERSTAERRTEQAEQELWALTGADQPDAAKIEAKLKEVEQLRTNQRMAFIRAVGEASNVLTAEQRNVALGMSMPKK